MRMRTGYSYVLSYPVARKVSLCGPWELLARWAAWCPRGSLRAPLGYMRFARYPPGYPTRDSLGGIPHGIPTISPRDRPGSRIPEGLEIPWDISWWPLQGTPNPSPRALEVQSLWSAVKDRSEKDSTYQFSLYRMCLLFALVVYRTHVLSLCLADRN
jgi:hypothetical protein